MVHLRANSLLVTSILYHSQRTENFGGRGSIQTCISSCRCSYLAKPIVNFTESTFSVCQVVLLGHFEHTFRQLQDPQNTTFITFISIKGKLLANISSKKLGYMNKCVAFFMARSKMYRLDATRRNIDSRTRNILKLKKLGE